MIRLKVLTDNRVRRGGFFAEHGLSFLIETEKQVVLFDTGFSDVYIKNDHDNDLSRVKYIVLSHGHYDHGLGLRYFPFEENNVKVIAQRDAFKRKMSLNGDGSFRNVGIDSCISLLEDRVIYPEGTFYLDDIIVVGRIPSIVDFEGVPEGFFIKNEKEIIHDMMDDEQILIVEEEECISIFVGCGHPGIINCINFAHKLVPGKRIKLVAGGMHLNNISSIRLQLTIHRMLEMGIEKIAPCHCTGFDAMCEMKRILKDKFVDIYAGEEYVF